MSGFNQDSIGVTVPVDSIATGVWSEKTKQSFIATDIVPRNPFLELNEGKIFVADNKRDVINDKPTHALQAAPQVNYSESSVDYRREKYRRSFNINPTNFRKDLPVALGKLKQQQAGARVIGRNLRVLFESIVASKVFNTSNFNNTAASVAWATIATAVPVTDLNTAGNLIKKARSVKPNIVIMGATAYSNFISNANVKASIKNTEDALVKRNRVLDLMRTDSLENLEYLYVADASYNTANVGQAESRSFIWTPTMVFIGYVEQSPNSEEMNTAFALSSELYTDSMGQNSPIKMRTYRNEEHEEGTEVLEGLINFDLPIVDGSYGQLITVT